MKDPELMMYRVAIGQILADAGINRETIKEMLSATIDEKVEKQLGNVVAEKCRTLNYKPEFRSALQEVVKDQVHREMSGVRVHIEFPLSSFSDEELKRELARRGLLSLNGVLLEKPVEESDQG